MRTSYDYFCILLLMPSVGTTINDIHLQLAHEESRNIISGSYNSSSGMSPSDFIVLGLEIEEQQYVYFIKCMTVSPSPTFTDEHFASNLAAE